MILVLSDLWVPFPGGAERLMFNLARDLMQRGETVGVVTGYHRAQPFDGAHVAPPLIVPDAPDVRYMGARALTGLIADTKPDVILTHHHWAFTFERELVATGVPIVQVVLNGHRIPEAALAVFISEEVRARREMVSGFNDLTIYPLAFDDVRAETHGDAIGFIKPLHHKGVDLFYDIAAAMPDRQFVVLRGEWQNIETIKPFPHVQFMEPVDDIRRFYEKCRVVLMPSLSEDAGTVAQECTVNAIPCISSNVGGLAETNLGGIRLTAGVDEWVKAIRLLDDHRLYNTVVLSQSLNNPTSQTEKLEQFADRVRALRP